MTRDEYYTALINNSNYLEHEGVKGMKHGVRNGPPYPLNSEGKLALIKQRRKQAKKELLENDDNAKRAYKEARKKIKSNELNPHSKEYQSVAREQAAITMSKLFLNEGSRTSYIKNLNRGKGAITSLLKACVGSYIKDAALVLSAEIGAGTVGTMLAGPIGGMIIGNLAGEAVELGAGGRRLYKAVKQNTRIKE